MHSFCAMKMSYSIHNVVARRLVIVTKSRRFDVIKTPAIDVLKAEVFALPIVVN